jgi:hypothetical protein
MEGLIQRLQSLAITAASLPSVRDLADELLFTFGWQTNYSAETIAEVRADGWKCETEDGTKYTDTLESFMDCACWYPPGAKPFRDGWIHGHVRPNPLLSLDDARKLIPSGLYWHAGEGKTRADEPLGAASIIAPGSLETIAEAEHTRVEVAMCIASLKARKHKMQGCVTPAEKGDANA